MPNSFLPPNDTEQNKDNNRKGEIQAPMNLQFDFNKLGIGKADIESEARRLEQEANEAQENKGLFKVMPANKWIERAKKRPMPKMLFAEYWFEGELCILFADTNLGKSILAVQIGNSISKGEQIPGFKLETLKQPILYFDFELTDKQFEGRYSVKNEVKKEYENHYNFDLNNFIRVEINPDADIPEGLTFEEYLNQSLEQSIIETQAKVLIIDNLTYLKTETEKAKDALPLMKELKALKNKFGLSILCLAHTPKRDLTKPITRNDLQGSKMLINFCDSSFTIGESHSDKNLRYLKQIKQRNTEQIYDTDNVCISQISKPDNFLRFEFITFGREKDHLKPQSQKDKDKLKEQILELTEQGKSLREIGAEIGVSHMKVKRILKEFNNL
jgi:RecA-family ATPase